MLFRSRCPPLPSAPAFLPYHVQRGSFRDAARAAERPRPLRGLAQHLLGPRRQRRAGLELLLRQVLRLRGLNGIEAYRWEEVTGTPPPCGLSIVRPLHFGRGMIVKGILHSLAKHFPDCGAGGFRRTSRAEIGRRRMLTENCPQVLSVGRGVGKLRNGAKPETAPFPVAIMY